MKTEVFVNDIRDLLPKRLQRKLPQEVAVISLSEARSQELNRIYREKDQPTNVLSFRYDEKYGEVLLCPAVIRQEAKLVGNTYRYQMTWMVVHGMLHLAGMHHEESATVAKLVEEIEAKIVDKLFAKK